MVKRSLFHQGRPGSKSRTLSIPTTGCGAGDSVRQAACPGSAVTGSNTRCGSYLTAAWRGRTCSVVSRTSRTVCLRTGRMRGRALRWHSVSPFLCMIPRRGSGLGAVVNGSSVELQRDTSPTPCTLHLSSRMARGRGRTSRVVWTNTQTPSRTTGRRTRWSRSRQW